MQESENVEVVEPPEPSNSQSQTVCRRRRGGRKKKNYTDAEMEVLVDKVIEKFDLLYPGKEDQVPMNVRNDLWAQIVTAVNSVGVDERTVQELKKKWVDLRAAVKKKIALIARSCKLTGGGPSIDVTLTTFEEKVAQTYKPIQIEGVGDVDVQQMTLRQELPEEPPAEQPLTEENIEAPSEILVEPQLQPQQVENIPLSTSGDPELSQGQMQFLESYLQQCQSGSHHVANVIEKLINVQISLCETVAKGFQQLGQQKETSHTQTNINSSPQSSVTVPLSSSVIYDPADFERSFSSHSHGSFEQQLSPGQHDISNTLVTHKPLHYHYDSYTTPRTKNQPATCMSQNTKKNKFDLTLTQPASLESTPIDLTLTENKPGDGHLIDLTLPQSTSVKGEAIDLSSSTHSTPQLDTLPQTPQASSSTSALLLHFKQEMSQNEATQPAKRLRKFKKK